MSDEDLKQIMAETGAHLKEHWRKANRVVGDVSGEKVVNGKTSAKKLVLTHKRVQANEVVA